MEKQFNYFISNIERDFEMYAAIFYNYNKMLKLKEIQEKISNLNDEILSIIKIYKKNKILVEILTGERNFYYQKLLLSKREEYVKILSFIKEYNNKINILSQKNNEYYELIMKLKDRMLKLSDKYDHMLNEEVDTNKSQAKEIAMKQFDDFKTKFKSILPYIRIDLFDKFFEKLMQDMSFAVAIIDIIYKLINDMTMNECLRDYNDKTRKKYRDFIFKYTTVDGAYSSLNNLYNVFVYKKS